MNWDAERAAPTSVTTMPQRRATHLTEDTPAVAKLPERGASLSGPASLMLQSRGFQGWIKHTQPALVRFTLLGARS